MLKMFIFEVLLNIIQPFPFLESSFKWQNHNTPVTLSISHICVLFIVIRVYLTYKILDHYNIWTSERAKRIANHLGFEPDSRFATKVLLKTSPLVILGFICTIFVIILSFLLKGFEYNDTNDKTNNFRYFMNALFVCLVTMSTSNLLNSRVRRSSA